MNAVAHTHTQTQVHKYTLTLKFTTEKYAALYVPVHTSSKSTYCEKCKWRKKTRRCYCKQENGENLIKESSEALGGTIMNKYKLRMHSGE